jgi:Xaa-Pro aminopeptidase
MTPTHEELAGRLERFKKNLASLQADWEICVLMDRITSYYFTGTLQNGVLVIPRDKDAVYYVRKSCERAAIESNFGDIRCFRSFKDIELKDGGVLYCDTEKIPLAHFERFSKYFKFSSVRSADLAVAETMAVKSPFELEIMKAAGEIHRSVLEEYIPSVLREGMSEVELGALVQSEMLRRGHHAVTRTSGYGTELHLGLFCFGESALFHNTFDGPGGVIGLHPAVPLFGCSEVKLKKHSPVFVDIGCNVGGYHTDKTSIYSVGLLSAEARDFHDTCVMLQNRAATMLKPGAVPSEIYRRHIEGVDTEFLKEYNGFGAGKVKFLGHGIGLHIDQYPVIAEGFEKPLEENMVLAIEPKRGIEGLGMVGVENTFIVTPEGGQSITGSKYEIIQV